MCNRVESKGLNGDDGDEWTSKYIKFWWSPADKASYTIGTPVYNSKLSIYRRAMNAWS